MFPFIFGILVTVNIATQKSNTAINERIRQVENNLSPDIIYSDTILKLNLLEQMAA